MTRVLHSMKRDLGAHFAISRNLCETRSMKLQRAFYSAFYLLYAFWLAFRGMFHEQIGSRVKYRGKMYFISNWAGSGYPTLARDGEYLPFVPRNEIKGMRTLAELSHRFGAVFSWWMSSWHSIYVHKRMGY